VQCESGGNAATTPDGGSVWDTNITESINFSAANWQSTVKRKALVANREQTEWYIAVVPAHAADYERGDFLRYKPPGSVK